MSGRGSLKCSTDICDWVVLSPASGNRETVNLLAALPDLAQLLQSPTRLDATENLQPVHRLDVGKGKIPHLGKDVQLERFHNITGITY